MVDFVELLNKQTNSVRTIEELLLEFVLQTFKRYFQKFLPNASHAIWRDTSDNLYLLVPQYL